MGSCSRFCAEVHTFIPGELRKTVLTTDVKDWLAERSEQLLYHDCNNEGVFIGPHGVGSPLHRDQVSHTCLKVDDKGYAGCLVKYRQKLLWVQGASYMGVW